MGILKGKIYTYKWASMLILIYFIEGAVRSYSDKDLSSKIHIRDNDGKILKTFDSEDGCDFCEGTGKFEGFDCSFCAGKGKVGLTLCKTCNGKRRILGKQKLKGIKLTGEETKVEAMGHYSQDEVGKVGFLALVKR